MRTKEDLIKFLETRNDKDIESFISDFWHSINSMSMSEEKINNIQENGKSLYLINRGIVNYQDLNPFYLIQEFKYIINGDYIDVIVNNTKHFTIKSNENELNENITMRYGGDKIFNDYNEALLYIKNKIETRIEFLTKSLDYYGKNDLS
jgi:hypothetical protein